MDVSDIKVDKTLYLLDREKTDALSVFKDPVIISASVASRRPMIASRDVNDVPPRSESNPLSRFSILLCCINIEIGCYERTEGFLVDAFTS